MPALVPAVETAMPGAARTLLGYAFRPFFLLGGLWAIVAVLAWAALLHGQAPFSPGPDPVLWHAHEMVVGFGGAAVAGFLLTAVATWTGRPPVSGVALAWLVLAWCAGRIAMATAGALPAALVAVADLAFPALLAALAGREIVAGGSRRNYGILAGLAGFVALDAAFHAGRAGLIPGADRIAINLAAHALVLLVTVIGGRIVPSFTANWLRLGGSPAAPKGRALVESAVLPLTAAAALADVTGAPAPLVAIGAGAAALAHAARLAGWRGLATTPNPLLAILHVGYAWLPLGYGLLALAAASGIPPRTAALHALTMGGIGVMVLAVASRVALGHTGRPLVASAPTVAAYAILNGAVLARIAGSVMPSAYRPMLDLAALGWATAFALFLWVYWPILTGPRPDRGGA